MNNSHDTIQALIDRHVDFWTRSAGEQPLIARLPVREWVGKPYPISSGEYLMNPTQITPQDIDIERLLGLDRPLSNLTEGDMLQALGCAYPQAWMGSVLGCPILASAYGVVAKPVGVDVPEAVETFSIDEALESEWLPVMDAVLERAAEAAGDERPVQQLHLRGVIDMMAAYLGEERLCFAMRDCPEELDALADRFADLHIAVARRVLRLRKPWRGGYVSSWHVYASGPLLDYQIDASNLFSPRMYKRHFLKYDRKVLREFPYSVTHLHAVGLHQLDLLLTVPEMRAIQISLDRETGVWEKKRMLDCCQRIQQHGKGLVIHGELDDDELDEFQSVLSPRGLAITAFAPA